MIKYSTSEATTGEMITWDLLEEGAPSIDGRKIPMPAETAEVFGRLIDNDKYYVSIASCDYTITMGP